MPHLESTLQDGSESTCFANIAFRHGYWQLPLEEGSQELMSIQTPLDIYFPTRTLQGGTDSGNRFRAVTRGKFEGKVKRLP